MTDTSAWTEVAALRRRIEDALRKDCRWAETTGKDPEEVEIALRAVMDTWRGE